MESNIITPTSEIKLQDKLSQLSEEITNRIVSASSDTREWEVSFKILSSFILISQKDDMSYWREVNSISNVKIVYFNKKFPEWVYRNATSKILNESDPEPKTTISFVNKATNIKINKVCKLIAEPYDNLSFYLMDFKKDKSLNKLLISVAHIKTLNFINWNFDFANWLKITPSIRSQNKQILFSNCKFTRANFISILQWFVSTNKHDESIETRLYRISIWTYINRKLILNLKKIWCFVDKVSKDNFFLQSETLKIAVLLDALTDDKK